MPGNYWGGWWWWWFGNEWKGLVGWTGYEWEGGSCEPATVERHGDQTSLKEGEAEMG